MSAELAPSFDEFDPVPEQSIDALVIPFPKSPAETEKERFRKIMLIATGFQYLDGPKRHMSVQEIIEEHGL